MKFFKNTLALALIAMSSTSFAMDKGQTSFDLNIGSHHSDDTHSGGIAYNEDNYGLGASYAYEDWLDIKAGFFDNSYNKTSVYVGGSLNKDYNFNGLVVSPSAALLLTTGYQDTPENAPAVAPIPLLGLAVGAGPVRANIGYVPFGETRVFTLQMQFIID